MRQQSVRAGMWLAAIVMAAVAWVFGPSVAMADEKGNVVFFRGGYAGLTSDRSNEVFTDTLGLNGTKDTNTSGYYVGGGLDLMLSKDAWGMMNNISVLGEIGVEFKRWESNGVRNTTSQLLGGTATSVTQLTMLTVDISPKLKFNQFGNLVPWIIPIGLDFHVISPPSNNSNYLDIGVQFGAGAEYQVWKEFKLGVDARFHLASNQTSTVNNFFTVGPYVGIGF